MTATVTLSKKYVTERRPVVVSLPPPAWRGLRVDYATAVPQLLHQLAVWDPAGCVAVTEVVADSPTWQAGLRRGMFISHVDARRVTTPAEFHRLVAAATGPVPLRSSPFGDSSVRVVPAEVSTRLAAPPH